VLSTVPVSAQVDLPEPSPLDSIVVTAEAANRWTEGAYEVWALRGHCRIVQGASFAQSDEAVVWIDRHNPASPGQSKIIAYLEGGVEVEFHRGQEKASMTDRAWLGRFCTVGEIGLQVSYVAGEPDVKPAVYHRGMQHRYPPSADTIRRTQFTQLAQPAGETAAGGPVIASAAAGDTAPPNTRRIWAGPRSDAAGAQAVWEHDPATDLWVGVIDGGVMMNIYGSARYGVIDVSADRVVIWTVGPEELDLSGEAFQDENIPLEIYLEGNIVFRQGESVIYARRMYYDVMNQRGTVLDAELLTPVPKYEGLLRLRADVLRRAGRGRYFAENSFITSSRMGEPGYRIQSNNIYFEDHELPLLDPLTGQPMFNVETGEPLVDHRRLATSQNNVLFLGSVPIFYWPTMATNLEDPSFYIRRVRIKNDKIYGTQILTNWDGFQLLGIRNPPDGTDWDLSLDYLGDRGLGHGSTLIYNRDGFFSLPGRTSGLLDYWGIEDHGLDNLGRGRRNLQPEKDYRHRLFWQHRQQLPGDFQLTGEVGWIGDRNFLEEYYEREWDELKDQSTGIELKRTRDNISWSVSADARLNDFFTQTEWLPRGDHFWLGQSLLGDRLTWYEHSHVGFARLRPADPPDQPEGVPFTLLPWENVPAEGEIAITRHEIDWPLQLGPVKAVPYALGELAHWGEDLGGDDLQRWYYQAGIRASMPMWRIDPTVESQLFNVHGLAHKIVFDAELSFAEANRSMYRLPLYEPLDDDNIEAARRRFQYTTFAAPPIPPQFDPRSYALRTGLGGWVTSPSAEIADDLAAMRLGMRHRWQTKRGMPGSRRIIDWIVLDASATWFPDGSRDDFGKALGLLDYDFRWHVGDRLTLLSDGIFDFFTNGQQVVTFGGFLSRPPRGSLYLGLRILEGPIDSKVLTLSYSYWMSPKWISSFGTSVDLAGDGNIGQNFQITRIGESLLISAGFTVDAARDNVGVKLAIEPRFLPKGRLGRVGGAQIPVAGTFGLE